MTMQGKLLIASPVLKDPVFGGTVVLVSKYDPSKGAEGFILNGPILGKVGYGEMAEDGTVDGVAPEDREKMKGLIDAGKIESVPLRAGGPCHIQGFFMIHGHEEYLSISDDQPIRDSNEIEFELGGTLQEEGGKESKIIIPGVYFGTPEVMANIVMTGKVVESKFRFFTGIAAWSPGQLEREIEAGAWELKDSNAELIFNQEELEKLAHQPPPEEPHHGIPQPSWN
jgi:putative AlgH/UPF0301 family transcriptional regulator